MIKIIIPQMLKQNLNLKCCKTQQLQAGKMNQEQAQTEGRFSVKIPVLPLLSSQTPPVIQVLWKAKNLLPATGKKQENWRPVYSNFYISKFA